MTILQELQDFCEENKINIVELDVNKSYAKSTKITVGCQFCSKYFVCQVVWLLRQDECRCKKCRKLCQHDRQRSKCKELNFWND